MFLSVLSILLGDDFIKYFICIRWYEDEAQKTIGGPRALTRGASDVRLQAVGDS